MLASFPNVDYKDQKDRHIDVTAKPVFVVATRHRVRSTKSLEATDTAVWKSRRR